MTITGTQEGIHWDLTPLYPGLDSASFLTDFRTAYNATIAVRDAAAQLDTLNASIAPPYEDAMLSSLLQHCLQLDSNYNKAQNLLADLHVYCTAKISIDNTLDTPRTMLRKISALSAQLNLGNQTLSTTLATLPDEVFQHLLSHTLPSSPASGGGGNDSDFDGHTLATRWVKLRAESPTGPEERFITLLAPEASRAWTSLYERLANELVVTLIDANNIEQKHNLTQAIAAMVGTDPTQRQRAWHAIRAAWAPHETTVAAVLNSLAGHRLKVHQLRGHNDQDVLALSVTENRLSRTTLEALMTAAKARRPQLRKAVHLMARLLSKDRLDSWDLSASYTEKTNESAQIPIDIALDQITATFTEIAPDMGEFVSLMRKNNWIDAQPHNQGRRLGGYQTSVRRGRHPLVFTNYRGRWLDVITLAHELGHAYQYWLMRNMPPESHHLPMALAECASSFAEMQMRRNWAPACENQAFAQRCAAWDEAQSVVAFLLNIPASFTFERELYTERRKRELDAAGMCDVLNRAWEYWFGDSLGTYDDRGWIRKPHFAGSRIFYNYPYMIGYLVAVLLDNAYRRMENQFNELFRGFLVDSASLTLEQLLRKYFDGNPETVEFWESVLDIVEGRLRDVAERVPTGIGFTNDNQR